MMFFAAVVIAFAGLDTVEHTGASGDACVSESVESSSWYFSIGAINLYPKLRESEKKIDEKINNLLGVFPFWEEPTTFKDWRDNHSAWDVNIGIGRDLSLKLTLMVWVGGAKGVINNKDSCGLIDMKVRFARTALFLAPELSWYLWGKVDYSGISGKKGGDWVRAALSGRRPFLAAATGYTWVRAEGWGKFSSPILGTFYRDEEKDDHHLFMLSPRAGIEIPIGKNSSFTIMAFYNFYTSHEAEYNGPCMSLNYRLRF